MPNWHIQASERLARVPIPVKERNRLEHLVNMVPADVHRVLDVGARFATFAGLLVNDETEVVALDLARPTCRDPRVVCLQGDANELPFANSSMDLVACTEVLEHIPAPQLARVCEELTRVAARYVLIGVPYRQDIRVGRTTCTSCGTPNPPWGHVNSFDETDVFRLFPNLIVNDWKLVGPKTHRTNWLAARMLDWAGNPYGTYGQLETCVHCNAQLQQPPKRNLAQKFLTRGAFMVNGAHQLLSRPNGGTWVHVLLEVPGHRAARSDASTMSTQRTESRSVRAR